MNARATFRDRPSGFTRNDLLAVIVTLGVLFALGCPWDYASREAARRMSCTNNLKQIGLALHNYGQANKAFPPGTVCTSNPIQPSSQYDVLAEAAQTGSGPQGTGFLLRIFPFIEGDSVSSRWDWTQGISTTIDGKKQNRSNFQYANFDEKGFYCPTRRSALRPGDRVMMLSTAWTGGGTDYGGCAGRHAAFTLGTGYNLCDASMHYKPEFSTTGKYSLTADTAKERWGLFGRVNVGTQFKDIKDGLSYTIMTGELQRISDLTPTSKDGWVIGGPATLFTTGAMFNRNSNTVAPVGSGGMLMNNGFFGSPGSDHANGANFGMADGSVTFFSDSMDPNVFALLGSMADGVAANPYPVVR
jgi:prepilin-type processing-associated H-X9-DG protein